MADGGDVAAGNADIGSVPGRAGAIDDAVVADEEVEVLGMGEWNGE
jgi:hypothetical protein